MGRYFKIIDKRRTDGHIRIVDAPSGSQLLFCEIEELVGMLPNPINGIPHALEVDGWGELACIDEVYESAEFVVHCISEEDYEEYND